MGKEGARDEMIYAGQAELDAEQEATANRLLEGNEFSLVQEGAGVDAAQVAQSPAEKAVSDRAEKNAKMMAELIKQKLSAMLDGNTAEEARIAGLIKVLEERM